MKSRNLYIGIAVIAIFTLAAPICYFDMERDNPNDPKAGNFVPFLSWKVLANMPTLRSKLASAEVNGKIYVFGGQNSSGIRDVVEAYDPSTDTWERDTNNGGTLTPMPVSLANIVASAVNGKIYVFGNEVLEYDPALNSWRRDTAHGGTLAQWPALRGRSLFSGAAVNNKIYIIGGESSGALPYVDEFDPAANGGDGAWTTKTDMPNGRYSLASVALNGKIYAIGGIGPSGASPVAIVEVYDPSLNSWTSTSSMPTARVDLAAGVINGKVYAIGGYDAITRLKTVEEYDPLSNQWKEISDMTNIRDDLATTSLNSAIYAIGGYSGASYVDLVEKLSYY